MRAKARSIKNHCGLKDLFSQVFLTKSGNLVHYLGVRLRETRGAQTKTSLSLDVLAHRGLFPPARIRHPVISCERERESAWVIM